MARMRMMTAALAAVATMTLGMAGAQAASTIGAPGAGDPYFPAQGNGGYDVSHYKLNITYTPDRRALSGVALISATATQDLSQFDLDLRRNMHVLAVDVDGAAATYRAEGQQELVIAPDSLLGAGHHFLIAVQYRGIVKPVTDPDGSPDGFIPTDDGAFVASEPQGSPAWFPVNDTPADKATYDVSITVPAGLQAIGNGHLLSVTHGKTTTTWRWHLGRPVSSYLITASIGHFDLTFGHTSSGLPYVLAVDPREKAAAMPVLAKLPAIIDYYSSVYGTYPFGTAGAIVDHAPQVGYALETATRPLFDRAPDELTLAHELAHQWFGDSVTLTVWRGIWLNEGFAEFSSWLWDERRGRTSGAEHLKRLLQAPASNSVWSPPPASPGSGEYIFSNSVYERGAGTLQALRQLLGDKAFFQVMRGWYAAHRFGNAKVGQFVDYAAATTGRHAARTLLHEWLFTPGKPGSSAADAGVAQVTAYKR